MQPEIFQGKGEGFVELGHFDKDFVKGTRKRGSAGKHYGVTLLKTLLETLLKLKNLKKKKKN